MGQINIAELKIGQKVYYQPDYNVEEDKWENGMIKSIPEWTDDTVFVVYNCAGDWKNFKDYTAANTNIRDLKLGWRHEEEDVECNTCGYIMSYLEEDGIHVCTNSECTSSFL